MDKGFFQGYNEIVWIVIALQSFGGLMISVVIKYADNILKSFSTSCAIIVTCVASVLLFDFHVSLRFASGTTLIMLSIFAYSLESVPTCSMNRADRSNTYCGQQSEECFSSDSDALVDIKEEASSKSEPRS